MAPRLKSLVSFENIAAGATPSEAHNLNVAGIPVVPDEVKLSNPDFSFVAADDETVTVRNDGAAVGDCDVLCECWHTVERVFGAAQTKELATRPFNAATGGGSASAAAFLGYFGDGSDGDVVLVGDEGANERWYENLDTAGFDVNIQRLFVRDTLTIRAGSRVYFNGADGVGPTGGAQQIATIMGVGGGGGDEGLDGSDSSGTNGYGGDGGAGGASPAGAGGAAGTSAVTMPETQPRQLPEIVTGRVTGRWSGPGYDRILGGGGGGGGQGNGIAPPNDKAGGGGGAGGNVIVVSARHIVIEAGGYIEANGGDGADGEADIGENGTGGGGGGGGGCVLICYETMDNNGTIQAAGGAGGAAGGAGDPGQDGQDGNVFMLKVIP
jgi:hypothetical protein